MGKIKIPYVERVTAKGHIYHYYRRGGVRWARLSGEPGTGAFAATYERAVALYEGRRADAMRPGSFGALVVSYLKSADYKGLGDRTRVEYRRHLDAMTSRWRDLPLQLGKVDAVTRKHILEYRDEFADSPSVGNARVKVLRLLLSFAVDRGLMTANPSLRIKRMAEGEYEPWPEAIIKQFRGSEPAPEILLAFEIALHTGQRMGDLVRMLWSQFDGEGFQVRQGKTGVRLWVPCHPDLEPVLSAAPKRAAVILTTPTGRAWTTNTLSHDFREATRGAGIEGYVFHGLRKTAAVKLAEAGFGEEQIKSVCGWKSTSMVQHYTKGASQKVVAMTVRQRWLEADKA